jgi:hypothetical protein
VDLNNFKNMMDKHVEGCKCSGCNGGGHSCGCGGDCNCGSGSHHWGGESHVVLRIFLGIVILGIVYAVGMKVGEFKSDVMNGYFGDRHGFMMRGSDVEYGTFNAPVMMRTYSAPETTTPTTPAK